MASRSVFEQPYSFTASNVTRVRDAGGLVHEVFRAGYNDRVVTPFWSRTRCKRKDWHPVEPIMSVYDHETVTCIECLSTGDDDGVAK